jgi:hypothetical protein
MNHTARATSPRRANKYPGHCRTCGGRVLADAGWLAGRDPESGRWCVECRACAGVVEEAERRSAVDGLERARAEAERAREDGRLSREAEAKAERAIRARQAQEEARLRREAETEERYRAMIEENERCGRLIEELLRLEQLGRMRIPKCLTTLGLTPPVTVEMVKARYRALAKQAHPDAGGSAARFVALKTARDQALTFAVARL